MGFVVFNSMHFWYSEKMMSSYLLDGDEPNKCVLTIEDEDVELEYTHCHGTYIESGGSSWGDEVYLGFGKISFIGKKPSIDRFFEGI